MHPLYGRNAPGASGLRRLWSMGLGLAGLAVAGVWVFKPQAPLAPEKVSSVPELETYMKGLVGYGVPPGMSLVAVKDGDVVYSKGFGWADEPRGIPATSESVYHWWSCTKIVTAIAILQLEEGGKLALGHPVVHYLPFFNVKYPSAASGPVTIENLLNHSSGLPEPGLEIMSWIHHEGEPSVNQTAMVKRVLPEFSKLKFEPGDHAEYTNLGYMVLGAVIEKVAGQTYESYVKEHILDPLGMNHTDFIYTKVMEPYEAAGSHPLFDKLTPLVPFEAPSYVRGISGDHLWFKRVYNDQTPPTGLIGSVADAARLAAAYLNGGELDGKRILSVESVRKMTTHGHIAGRSGSAQPSRERGIGWGVYADGKRHFLEHQGGGLGFSTIIRLYPAEKLGLVLFTNDMTCDTRGIVSLAGSLIWDTPPPSGCSQTK